MTFNVQDGNCSHMIGVLSREDVLDAKQDPLVTYKRAESVYGGDFFSSLKNAFNKTKDFLGKTKLVSTIAKNIQHPYAQAIGKFAEQHGYGISGGRKKGKAKHKRRYGAGLDMDDKPTKKNIKNRLKASDLTSDTEGEINSCDSDIEI